LLWLCFGISGAAALVLEMLWMRSAGLVLGATAPTAATVLAYYFAGLGLGAASARRVQWRPVRVYGLLELGAGLGAIWSLGVFRALASEPAQAWLAVLGPMGRIAAIAVALLPATLCLGATLPTLAQALITIDSVGHRGGLLYALNILGGVLGTVAMGFGLPAIMGVSASYSAAAGASLLAGVGALALARRQEGVFIAPFPREEEALQGKGVLPERSADASLTGFPSPQRGEARRGEIQEREEIGTRSTPVGPPPNLPPLGGGVQGFGKRSVYEKPPFMREEE